MKLKKILIPALCAGLVGVMGTACSNNKNDQTKVDTRALLQSGKTMAESAENLSLAGEQLLSPISFMYADIVFDVALSADANNKRAQFYKALIKPMMAMKGSLNRIKPVVDTLSDEQQKKYNEFVEKTPNSALKTFLLDGPQDINNEEDALKFMDSYRSAWEEIRIFMKENKDLNLDINVMTLVGTEGALNKAAQECVAANPSESTFTLENCDVLNALKINVSRADIEALQQIAAGMQIYHILGTSYSLDGVRDFSDKNKDKQLTREEVIEHFKNSTTAGELRNNELSKIPEMGIDAIAGARWALDKQNTLCARGVNDKGNRKGSLFEEGVCLKQKDADGKPTEDLLKTIEAALTGGLISIEGLKSSGEVATAEIKVIAPLMNPIKDLRTIAPTSYNKCGKAVKLADNTLGGLFVNGDANTYLKSIGDLDNNNCD